MNRRPKNYVKCVNFLSSDSYAVWFDGTLVSLDKIDKYDKPLIIGDGKPRVVFPPFSNYTVIEKGGNGHSGCYSFISSDVVGLFEYIHDNPGVIDEIHITPGRTGRDMIAYAVKEEKIDSGLYTYGWSFVWYKYHRKPRYTNYKTGEVVHEILDVIRLLDLDREWDDVCNNTFFIY